jgi:hypothetical protein
VDRLAVRNHAEDHDRQQDEGKRQLDIARPHEEGVDRSAVEAGDRAGDEAEDRGDECRGQADHER